MTLEPDLAEDIFRESGRMATNWERAAGIGTQVDAQTGTFALFKHKETRT